MTHLNSLTKTIMEGTVAEADEGRMTRTSVLPYDDSSHRIKVK